MQQWSLTEHMHCRLDKDRIQDSRLQQQNQHSSEGLDSSGLVDHEDDHGGNHVLNELDPAPQPFHYLYKFIIPRVAGRISIVVVVAAYAG